MERMGAVEQAGCWIGAGIPVVASVAWENDHAGQQFSGVPLPRSDGHLLMIRGFTGSGDVIVNDPAGPGDADVSRVYARAEFSRAWLRNPDSSGGVVYLIHPAGASPTPAVQRGAYREVLLSGVRAFAPRSRRLQPGPRRKIRASVPAI